LAKRETKTDAKTDSLRRQGTLNRRPERVRDPLFRDSPFFDARDLVQVKYEMLRKTSEEGHAVTDAAAAFGFSRPAFYQARQAFEREGLIGLVPKKRGPRGAHKLTDEVLDFIEAKIEQDRELTPRALAPAVHERFGVSAHARSIERALARRKKKRRAIAASNR